MDIIHESQLCCYEASAGNCLLQLLLYLSKILYRPPDNDELLCVGLSQITPITYKFVVVMWETLKKNKNKNLRSDWYWSFPKELYPSFKLFYGSWMLSTKRWGTSDASPPTKPACFVFPSHEPSWNRGLRDQRRRKSRRPFCLWQTWNLVIFTSATCQHVQLRVAVWDGVGSAFNTTPIDSPLPTRLVAAAAMPFSWHRLSLIPSTPGRSSPRRDKAIF